VKLGIGTAQFGLAYGISNRSGQVPPDEVEKILKDAHGYGIKYIDTAALYGESESVLGRCLPNPHAFRVVTKTKHLSHSNRRQIRGEIQSSLQASLDKLRCARVYGFLIHRAEDILSTESSAIIDELQAEKAAGMVEKIGVSVYTGAQVDKILDKFTPDIVQLPINILDQRLLRSGHLEFLKSKNVEIHARSVFLQGLLLMSPEEVPPFLDKAKPHLSKYHAYRQSLGIAATEAALSFVTNIPEIDVVICGIENTHQLSELCVAAVKPCLIRDWSKFALEDEEIINPVRWGKTPGHEQRSINR